MDRNIRLDYDFVSRCFEVFYGNDTIGFITFSLRRYSFVGLGSFRGLLFSRLDFCDIMNDIVSNLPCD